MTDKEEFAVCEKCNKKINTRLGQFFDYTGMGYPVFYCDLCLGGKNEED